MINLQVHTANIAPSLCNGGLEMKLAHTQAYFQYYSSTSVDAKHHGGEPERVVECHMGG